MIFRGALGHRGLWGQLDQQVDLRPIGRGRNLNSVKQGFCRVKREG